VEPEPALPDAAEGAAPITASRSRIRAIVCLTLPGA